MTMQSVEVARQVRLHALEAALLSVLRAAEDEGYDAIEVHASVEAGQTVIDLSWLTKGMPMAGESL